MRAPDQLARFDETEFYQKRITIPTGTLALFKLALVPQYMVKMLCKAVSFIADVLQQPKRERMATEYQRAGIAGQKNLFFALG